MLKYMRIILALSLPLCYLASPSRANASLLFSDNFDAQADWQPRPSGVSNDASPAGGAASCDFNSPCSYPVPTGWNYFRVTGLWWGPIYQDTLRITNQQGRGESGKAFIEYTESNNGASGDGWGADGQLTKLLDQDYQEIYARIWIKTETSWQWNSTNDMIMKMFRAYHFDRSGSIYVYFSAGNSCPIALWDFKHSNTWGTRGMNTFRGDPQETRYYMDGDSGTDYLLKAGDSTIEPNSPGMLADGQWHSLEFHLKMNSYNSGTSTWNADGIYELWNDGELKFSRSNLLWKSTGSDPAIGWNTISIGGNAFNLYTDPANHGEQWYAIDDVVVSTHYSGPPQKPVSVTAALTSGTNVRVNWAAGTNGATYLLDSYRIYYGTDPANLTSTVNTGNVTSYEIQNLPGGQTYYFAVKAFNKAAYDSNENESLPSSTVSVVVAGSGDTTPPTITAFSIPGSSTSLTVPISSFTASDNVAVTGYLVTDVAATPSAGAIGWSATAPSAFTFGAEGVQTAYAWAKDAAGNISNSASANVVITLPDSTPPTINTFNMPATASSLTVPVSSFTATDAVGVTGYMITESSSAPAAGAAGWSASAPTSFTFSAEGARTAYAWAKDAAGMFQHRKAL